LQGFGISDGFFPELRDMLRDSQAGGKISIHCLFPFDCNSKEETKKRMNVRLRRIEFLQNHCYLNSTPWLLGQEDSHGA
jgi:hypothetical protein